MCGYDLAGQPREWPCPECGRRAHLNKPKPSLREVFRIARRSGLPPGWHYRRSLGSVPTWIWLPALLAFPLAVLALETGVLWLRAVGLIAAGVGLLGAFMYLAWARGHR